MVPARLMCGAFAATCTPLSRNEAGFSDASQAVGVGVANRLERLRVSMSHSLPHNQQPKRSRGHQVKSMCDSFWIQWALCGGLGEGRWLDASLPGAWCCTCSTHEGG